MKNITGAAHHKPCPEVARYLITQCWLSPAIGLLFGIALLVGDIGGMRPLVAPSVSSDVLILLAGSVVTFLPLVLTTAIGLLAYGRD
jgi:hypothetical protein